MSESTVFIIHRQPQIRDLLGQFCVGQGLRVEARSSAEEFLASYDAKLPGCVLLEQHLPGLTGLELQQVLAAYEIILPVIY